MRTKANPMDFLFGNYRSHGVTMASLSLIFVAAIRWYGVVSARRGREVGEHLHVVLVRHVAVQSAAREVVDELPRRVRRRLGSVAVP